MQATVSDLLQAAFSASDARYSAHAEQWTRCSWRIEAVLPNSGISKKVQDMGRIDVLARSLEDERHAAGDEAGIFSYNNLVVFSGLFISGIYAVLRVLSQRLAEFVRAGGDPASISISLPELQRLHRDFELIRVPLEKFELPQDRKISDPIEMFKLPVTDETSDIYVYDRKDWQRSTILPIGSASSTGSVGWFVSSLTGRPKWLYRRDLSDAFLAFADVQPVPPAAARG